MAASLGAVAKNWKLKALALALAILLWVVVSAEQVTSNWIPVPLQVQVLDPGYELVPQSVPGEVEVRFAGPGRELWDLVIRRPPLNLVISEVDDPTGVFTLDPRMVRVPAQMSVGAQEVRPAVVRLNFVELATRTVPVRVPIAAGLREGLMLVDGIVVSPAQVQISGRADQVNGITEIATRPVDLSGVDTAFSRVIPLDTEQMQGVRLSATEVRVSGRADRMVERVLASVPVDVGGGVDLRPRVVDVRLQGPGSVLAGIQPGTFRVVVSIDSIPTRIPAEGIDVPLRVERLPVGVQAETSPRAARLFPVRPIGVPAEPPEPASADTVPAPAP